MQFRPICIRIGIKVNKDYVIFGMYMEENESCRGTGIDVVSNVKHNSFVVGLSSRRPVIYNVESFFQMHRLINIPCTMEKGITEFKLSGLKYDDLNRAGGLLYFT